MTTTTTSGMLAEPLLRAAEAAELLAVPESWVREAARARRIPSVVVSEGKHRRFLKSDLEQWVREQRLEARP